MRPKSTITVVAGTAIFVLAFCLPLIADAQDRAEERGGAPNRATEKLYGGVTLEVWQQRMGQVKPSSEYAAVLAPGLLEIVADRSAPDAYRERAALLLGRIGKPAADAGAVTLLGEILADTDESLSNRIWAGRALGYLGKYAGPVADALIEFLFDERIPLDYRAVPIEALGLMGNAHPNVLPALLRLYQYTPGEESRLSASDVTHLRELATEAFAMMGQDAGIAAPLLMRAVRDPSEVELIRRKSVIALGRIGSGAAVAIPVLIEAVEFDPSEAVRDEAARALAQIGEPAYETLRRYLAHPDAAVRWRFAMACGELKSPPLQLLVTLRSQTSDPDQVVRIAAIESLSKLAADSDHFMPAAIQLLASEDRQVRMRAMRLIVSHIPLRAGDVAALEAIRDQGDAATARIASLVLKKVDEAGNE